MNTHLKQLWAAMKLPKNFKKSYKFFCLGLDIRVAEIMKSYPLYTRPLNSGSHTMFHAGYGRGYVDAGPADPFQAETYDGF